MEATIQKFSAQDWAEHEQFVQMFRAAKARKEAWEEQTRREWEEMQIEVERAKADPFYEIGSGDSLMACEPAPMPAPQFKPGSLMAAIRKQRAYQQEWQERINRELDEREAEYLAYKKSFELEMEEV